MSTKAAERSRRQRAEEEQARARRRARVRAAAAWTVGIALLAGIVSAMLLTSRPQSSDTVLNAQGFTLANTKGESVSLEDFRGRNVLLYFSEGAGCQSCLVQIHVIEKSTAAFEELDATVLPIVNEHPRPDRRRPGSQ